MKKLKNKAGVMDKGRPDLKKKALQRGYYKIFITMTVMECETTEGSDELPYANRGYMPPCIDYAFGIALFDFLKQGGYIDANSDAASFFYLFGCTEERPKVLRPIRWMQNKQLLRETLELTYAKLLRDGHVNKTVLVKMAKICFIDTKGNAMVLAQNKVIYSYKSDEVKNFFATFSDTLLAG
ncbi:MAG: hypothetical protein ACSW8D_08155 [Prevotella sp.]